MNVSLWKDTLKTFLLIKIFQKKIKMGDVKDPHFRIIDVSHYDENREKVKYSQ